MRAPHGEEESGDGVLALIEEIDRALRRTEEEFRREMHLAYLMESAEHALLLKIDPREIRRLLLRPPARYVN